MMTDVDGFMATMVAPSRRVELERAAELARERYGFAPREIARSPGGGDEHCGLGGAPGAEYSPKSPTPAENPAETDFQTAALIHLEKADPALPCPRVVRERAGAAY